MTILSPSLSIADRYTLIGQISVGGMGEVWRARDEVLGRDVAVKVLHARYASDPTFLERFRNEARHTAALSHPGIAGVFDYGEIGDMAFLVMEYVAGEPLSQLLARTGALPVNRTLDIVGQAGLALQAAHEAGVIHRDVKPGNLLVRPDGVVKVTDFGIARVVDAAPVTQTGMLIGTAAYLSPEQAGGRPVTPASDVYSLGVVAYECLSGRQPFVADSAVATAAAHLTTTPPPLPDSVPEPVTSFVMRALDKDPLRRQRDAGDFGRTALSLAVKQRDVRPSTAVLPLADVEQVAAEPTSVTVTSEQEPVAAPTTVVTPMPEAPTDEDPARRRTRNIFIAVGAIVVVLGFLILHSCAGGVASARVASVVGERYAAAKHTLESQGFIVTRKNATSSQPPGQVTKQSLSAGTVAATDSRITLTVSNGPPRLTINPADYIGRQFNDVYAQLSAENLQVRLNDVPSPQPAGTVTAISPTGPVQEGATVTVSVAVGPVPPKPGKKHGPGKDHGHGHGND